MSKNCVSVRPAGGASACKMKGEAVRFNCLLADPPWSYRNKKTGGSMKSGSAAHYDTMTLEEICRLKVRSIAEKDSVLFLWVTVPMLEEGLIVMKAWGYDYKTMLTWHKEGRLGMGFWFRGQTEHLLFGVRGNVKAFRCQKTNFIQAKVLRHSEKPEEFRRLIEEATPHLTKRVELFARRRVPGWVSCGRELSKK